MRPSLISHPYLGNSPQRLGFLPRGWSNLPPPSSPKPGPTLPPHKPLTRPPQAFHSCGGCQSSPISPDLFHPEMAAPSSGEAPARWGASRPEPVPVRLLPTHRDSAPGKPGSGHLCPRPAPPGSSAWVFDPRWGMSGAQVVNVTCPCNARRLGWGIPPKKWVLEAGSSGPPD